jgi:hypothetical protein
MPCSTPQVVIDYLATITKDKTFCDVGCYTGKLLDCLKLTSSSLYGIEYNKKWVQIVQKKGHKVICGDAFKVKIPHVDIYYIWIDQKHKLLLAKRIKQKFPDSQVIVGYILKGKSKIEKWKQDVLHFDRIEILRFENDNETIVLSGYFALCWIRQEE